MLKISYGFSCNFVDKRTLSEYVPNVLLNVLF